MTDFMSRTFEKHMPCQHTTESNKYNNSAVI